MTELKDAVIRNRRTLAQDFLGAVCLVAMFVVVLTLPGLT